jgi:hypothetical protein
VNIIEVPIHMNNKMMKPVKNYLIKREVRIRMHVWKHHNETPSNNLHILIKICFHLKNNISSPLLFSSNTVCK